MRIAYLFYFFRIIEELNFSCAQTKGGRGLHEQQEWKGVFL